MHFALSELVDLIDRERNITQRKRNVEEIRIIEILDSLCDSTKDGGEWLKKLDIIESNEGKNRYLLLEEPGGIVLHLTSYVNFDNIAEMRNGQELQNAVMNARQLRNRVITCLMKSWTAMK